MLDFAQGGVDAFLTTLNQVYRPSIAALVSIGLLLLPFILGWIYRARVSQLAGALDAINAALAPVRDASDDNSARRALGTQHQSVLAAVRRGQDQPLRRAWEEFEESLVDCQSDVLSNSVRPDEFFHSFADRGRGLLWWANIAVAIGLVFTFLGIMAALGYAASTMRGAGDVATMQSALRDLLDVTAAKFMTSFAGVAASIILRALDVRVQRQLRERVQQMVDTLERGLIYLPPQRVAAEQLRALQQIELAQTKFATELAVAIGEKFNEHVQPMVTVLGQIDSSIQDLKREMTDGLTGAVGDSIGQAAGKEMQALASALTVMSERVAAVPDRLSASADDANARIEAAAQLFSQASAGISSSFATLEEKIEAMGESVAKRQEALTADTINQFGRMTTGIEGAASSLVEQLSRASAEAIGASAEASDGLTSAVGALAAKIEAMGEAVTARQAALADGMAKQMRDASDVYGASVERNREAMQAAGDDLRTLVIGMGSTLRSLQDTLAEGARRDSEAAADLARKTRRDIADATKDAAREFSAAAEAGARAAATTAAEALEKAFAELSVRLDESTRSLLDGLERSTTRMQAFGGSVERATERADQQADKLAAAGVAAERLGGQLTTAAGETTAMLGRAATALSDAAAPVREASEAIADGVEDIAEALRAQQEVTAAQVAQLRQLSDGFATTAEAARRAFEDYQRRFEGVDEALGSAFRQLVDAAADTSDKLNTYARKVDSNLADAVSRLVGLVDGLKEVADDIGRTRQSAKAA